MISVVTPAFNAAPYLAQAIDSVLAQTIGDLEIIVVDDGSTDDTARVAAAYGSRVLYLYQSNQGVSTARNRGLKHCRGDLVGFLDADDTWMPQKIKRQLEALTAAPHARMCYTARLVTDRDLKPISIEFSSRKASALEDLLLLGNVVGSPSSPLIDRRLLLEVGGFDPAYSHCADWELWVRLAGKTEFLYLPEPLVTYRQHGGNMSRQIETLERESRSLLEAAFDDPELPPAMRALRARSMGRNWMILAGAYFNAQRYTDFGRCAARALLMDPFQVRRLLSFPRRRLAGGSDWRRDLP